MAKVKFGLKNVYVAVATIAADGSATYGTPLAVPGAVSLTLDPEGETTPFRADNIDYWTSVSNNGYSGSIELALVPDEFRQQILGEVVGGNGLQYEKVVNSAVHAALMFQVENDVNATRHVFYNCVFNRPGAGSETTPTGGIEPLTETMDITASSVFVSALDADVVKAKCQTGDTAYATFFDAVVLPTV